MLLMFVLLIWAILTLGVWVTMPASTLGGVLLRLAGFSLVLACCAAGMALKAGREGR